ncbi:MAG: 4-alpha-glucanotransferase [Candidatus Methylarchaceae archaeon HK01B]|nr:4-alpha-glucanotransferase [Candidatus Methylarchaceae archaeon HK01B]
MVIRKRGSGILLHVTSLPSNFGIGDFGPWAFKFADLLSEARQSYWNILPLTPTSMEYGNSPYKADSSFAGNTLLISPKLLVKEKFLPDWLLNSLQDLPSKRVDYKAVSEIKNQIIKKAYEDFRQKIRDYSSEFETFCAENSNWLDDYTLYKALKEEIGKPWYLWPPHLRDREEGALEEKKRNLKDLIELQKFAQFVFFRQWRSLKEYCRSKRLNVIGDLPFYVSLDSSDVWAHPEIFKLDMEKRPKFVSGVPPDYFSDSGQLWGDPVYDWVRLAATHFEWWMDRIEHSLKLFDMLRLDHFRGFIAYWEVPSYAKKALNGKWVEIPSEIFFNALFSRFPDPPLIAEDLGFITAEVREVIKKYDIPGMKVLLFAFGGSPDNPYLPHNHLRNAVVLTGTHDTNTVRGWYTEEATQEERNMLFKYIGRKTSEEEVSWELIRLSMISVASLSIIPMQDVLSLGSESRMNRPAISMNNWEWRVTEEQFGCDAFWRLREMTEIFGRY